ncbi:MFS general substrate transporter [Panus rudis PR-1116 ss-1]|nr:MFS general substrate transporter [Panus rudis PR-1116 ss-1]
MTGGFAALPVVEDGGDDHTPHLAGEARILGPRSLQLPALTIGLLGVQVLWSIEMSYGTPYLLSLGLTKSAVSMVFLAGPISGFVVQPLIGVLADNSKSRFGRRRPFMLTGVLICVFAMLLLGFTRPFATIFTRLGSLANNLLTIWLAILALFTIDFSINAVQAVDRALLVDTLPMDKQADGNAWAARMLGIGSVAGYFIGNVDMTKIFPFLGETELEVLSVCGSFLLISAHIITAYCVKERIVIASKNASKSLGQEIKDIWTNVRTLPPVIRQICIIQFFAWLGWFPVLFNTTEFILELYKSNIGASDEDEAAAAEGNRLGSRAMFYNALLSLVANILLPFFVSEAGSRKRMQNVLAHGVKKSWWIRLYEKMKVHLATLWAFSHFLFAVCMGATFFYSSVGAATFFTTLVGFSWSITQWAPFSLLAEAILSTDTPDDTTSILLNDTRTSRRSGDVGLGADDDERQFLVGHDNDDDDDGLAEEVRSFRSSVSMDGETLAEEQAPRGSIMNNVHARMSHLQIDSPSLPLDDVDSHKDGRRGLAAKAGIILGIHNVFIVLPQMVMTGISSIIFAILEARSSSAKDPQPATNGTETAIVDSREALSSVSGPESYAFVFRIGGIAALVAFVLTIKLVRELRWH